ncbi:MAG: hypothetical protein V4598_18235 [Bdellovibrionota bacterium]
MFNRIILVGMALLLTINTSMASSHSGVKDALDEFQFAMTVDGAAFDSVKTAEATALLSHRLEGVGRQEIIEAALSGISDRRTAQEMREAFLHMKTAQLNSQEAGILINRILSESYHRGASWNGDLYAIQVFGVVVLAVAIVAGLINNADRN